MRVHLHAAAPALGNVDDNVAAVCQALGPGVDLVVFPELFLTGYNIGDDVQRLAFADGDLRLAPLQEAVDAAGSHLIVGAPYKQRDGITYNAALCMAPGEEPVWIPKRALPTFTTFREGLFFARGASQPVWRTSIGNIGISICYDIYFPELQKRQALEGADVLVNISASPSASRRFFEAIVPARAIENTVFSLYTNNVGAQDGIVFWGGARAIGPRGEMMGQTTPFEEGIVDVELDLHDLVAAREFRPTLRDTDIADLEAVES